MGQLPTRAIDRLQERGIKMQMSNGSLPGKTTPFFHIIALCLICGNELFTLAGLTFSPHLPNAVMNATAANVLPTKKNFLTSELI